MRAFLSATVWVLAACSGEVPDNPTWSEHVEPILRANCVRCHSEPASGGAPEAFRLDRYEDLLLHGEFDRGARTMLPWVLVRAVERGDMPPVGPGLSEAQKDTLRAWADAGAPLGPATEPPRMFVASEGGDILEGPGTWTADKRWSTHYRLVHPRGGIVDGELTAIDDATGEVFSISERLHDGLGLATWNTANVPEGTYTLQARLVGPGGAEEVVLVGECTVDHADENLLPRVSVQTPREPALWHISDTPGIRMTISDAEGGSVDRRVVATRGDQTIVILEDQIPAAAAEHEVPLDLSRIPDGANWRIEVTVTDREMGSTTARSGRFSVSRATTDLTWDDIEPIVDRTCLPCHPFLIDLDVSREAFVQRRGLYYQRVVLSRTMPPVSAAHDPWNVMLAEDERARIGEWLLGGTP